MYSEGPIKKYLDDAASGSPTPGGGSVSALVGALGTTMACMAANFTMMAHGENPRPQHRARVRQRYMHKLVYFPENHGAPACVGCGRCAVACPNRTGIDEVAARMRNQEEDSDG